MLNKLWPWKKIKQLETEAWELRAKNQQLALLVEKYEREAESTSKHVRKMAQIIAIKGGIM
jgi:hypothetical protein